MCENRDATVSSLTKQVLKCTLPEHKGNHYDAVMLAEWEPAPENMTDVEFRNWEQAIIDRLNMGGPPAIANWWLGFGPVGF
jgi:hypothetical protein